MWKTSLPYYIGHREIELVPNSINKCNYLLDLTVKRYIKGDTYHSNYSVLEQFEIAYHQKCVNQTKYISEKESKNTAHQEGMLSKEPVHLQKLNLILVFLDPGHKHTTVRLEEVVSYAISSMSQYSFLFSALKTHNNFHVAL